MNIIELKIAEVKPYEKNPRKHDQSVDKVANSIKEFGFKVPIVIDKNNIIVCGHTRYKAAKKLGLSVVPCVVADDLTEEQIKAYRLADNKVGEDSLWDMDLLSEELNDIFDLDMQDFGFDLLEDEPELNDDEKAHFWDGEGETNEEYEEFEDKFKPKLTTDDCYTPQNVYDVIKGWVFERYKLNKDTKVVRPFYPGGDYANEKYEDGCVVIDNPPFSILSEIINFYSSRNIKFFMFGPTMTLFSANKKCSYVIVDSAIVYENGAKVPTSFVTNFECDCLIEASAELTELINQANAENNTTKKLPKYEYPENVLTISDLKYITKHGISLKVKESETYFIRGLDSQKESGNAIFGSGYLLSEKAAAEKAAAEKAAAEKVRVYCWKLSEREIEIINSLGENNGQNEK